MDSNFYRKTHKNSIVNCLLKKFSLPGWWDGIGVHKDESFADRARGSSGHLFKKTFWKSIYTLVQFMKISENLSNFDSFMFIFTAKYEMVSLLALSSSERRTCTNAEASHKGPASRAIYVACTSPRQNVRCHRLCSTRSPRTCATSLHPLQGAILVYIWERPYIEWLFAYSYLCIFLIIIHIYAYF